MLYTRIIYIVLTASSLCLLTACKQADRTPKIEIQNAWSRPVKIESEDGTLIRSNGVVYLQIVNKGGAADRLTEASSPICDTVEMHETRMTGDRMSMNKIENGLEIPAGATLEFKPGGYHIMLIGLRQSLLTGEHFEVQLTFQQSGTIAIDSQVAQP